MHQNHFICFSQKDKVCNQQNPSVCFRCLVNKVILFMIQICDSYIDYPNILDKCTNENNEKEPLCEMMLCKWFVSDEIK